MTKLSKNPASVFNDDKTGFIFELLEKNGKQLKSWIPADGDPGVILGSAIHFVPRKNFNLGEEKYGTDTKEYFAAKGPVSHDTVIHYLDSEGFIIGYSDDDQTHYGFITSNGFFVDRHQANLIWNQMMIDSGWRNPALDDKNKMYLYSYDLKPEVINFCMQTVTEIKVDFHHGESAKAEEKRLGH